ncbi:HupE/UreJ family protein [Nonomuraea gerenzanensis]|uniref:Membrane protein n=1 Tax=Nonomuraea gerenzanensis TaxID=93944 RepID=A0A1M4DYU5_9ACTN|nr:HupE/UreJ family protein [Nonomuraea gerenzanensis]UBU14021.1 HupE/UreJ family protein [Nonomuraea gerenzanensis]SBO91707.1 Membrane protein [Nonomuraea gerenzanensis]
MFHAARRRLCAVVAAAAVAVLLSAAPVLAHGFTSTVYVGLTSPGTGHVRSALALEYDLLVVSAADAQHDEPLFRDGTAAFESGDTARQAAALDAHAASVLAYVTARYAVTAGGEACPPARDGGFTVEQRDGVPYALLVLDHRCPAAEAHEVRSGLFPDTEEYVRDTKTVVTYELDLTSGGAALDARRPSLSTRQSWAERFGEFFVLGAEHLLTGLDHLLFLLALIAGSRRLREIVLAATTFTLAHSVTFVLAALGLVEVPASFVEPVIALSIAVVAGWHLWRLWRRRSQATDLGRAGHLSLDRAGWTRLAVVFCFGLVHGLGFAAALGIDQPLSWTLLWSLVVFNVGIEAVQLAIIVVVFPLLAVVRRRRPVAGLWTTGAIAAGVSVMGLVWFAQRLLGG